MLVLDDVHALHNHECRAALSVLADHVPAGSRLALAGRTEPPLRLARLRAEGRILEIGPHDLSLTHEEASLLLRDAGVTLGEDDVTELQRRTEGWPAGLYLAALCLREGGPFASAAVSFGGDDRLVSQYIESEFLSRISRPRRAFLTQTAVLERMSGPLCEAVPDLPGAHAILADLAQSNLLLVPLDRRGEWYRYHRLFRDMLRAELERQAPELMPVLRRRAAGWCLRNDLPEEALGYFMAAGDVDAAARLVEKLVVPAYRQGRVTTAQQWFQWLQDRGARAAVRRPAGGLYTRGGESAGSRRPASQSWHASPRWAPGGRWDSRRLAPPICSAANSKPPLRSFLPSPRRVRNSARRTQDPMRSGCGGGRAVRAGRRNPVAPAPGVPRPLPVSELSKWKRRRRPIPSAGSRARG